MDWIMHCHYESLISCSGWNCKTGRDAAFNGPSMSLIEPLKDAGFIDSRMMLCLRNEDGKHQNYMFNGGKIRRQLKWGDDHKIFKRSLFQTWFARSDQPSTWFFYLSSISQAVQPCAWHPCARLDWSRHRSESELPGGEHASPPSVRDLDRKESMG